MINDVFLYSGNGNDVILSDPTIPIVTEIESDGEAGGTCECLGESGFSVCDRSRSNSGGSIRVARAILEQQRRRDYEAYLHEEKLRLAEQDNLEVTRVLAQFLGHL